MSGLFRDRVVELQRPRTLGTIRLATPVSHQVWGAFAAIASAAILLWLVSLGAWAAHVPSPEIDLAHFEAVCLKSDQLCRFVELDFSGDGTVREHTVAFVPIANQAEARFWNRRARVRTKSGQSTHGVGVAAYDERTQTWMPLVASAQCPLCVPDTARFDGSKTRWYRFDTTARSRWRQEHSTWIFNRIVGRHDQDSLYVVVRSHQGPIVCASIRSSGMHLDDSTAGSGGFRLLLNSDWVQTARPDYVTISPVCSWKNLAQHYMRMQALALAGRDHLPSFEGTAQQKIDQVVEYIEDHGIRYDEKLDAGGYPRQDVADIVKLRRTDCKGLTTLLYALLQNSGVKSDPVAMNAAGMTPMSFSVPDNWPNHAMLFIPSIDRYVDLTVVLKSHGKYTWQSSADSYAGEVVLDLVTGRFEVVPPRLVSSED